MLINTITRELARKKMMFVLDLDLHLVEAVSCTCLPTLRRG